MTSTTKRAWLAALILLALPLRPAHAQIEAGRVIDDATHAPLVNVPVSLEQATGNTWSQVDTAHTDQGGAFQFVLPRPGIYRVGFADLLTPVFYGPVDTLAADSMQQHEFALPIARTRGTRPYFTFEVDRPAAVAHASPMIEFPPALRSKGIDGRLVAQWVVGADGRADMTTFRVLVTTDSVVTEMVRRGLPRMKFEPATIGGAPVPQLVDQEMIFSSAR